MMFKLLFIALIVFVLSGCADQTNRVSGGFSYGEITYTLKDGRVITCIDGPQGALSCDWGND